MKRNRKTVTRQLMAVVLLVCGLLTGCGSETAPEQGDEKDSILAEDGAVSTTQDSLPADITSDVETPEAPIDFSNKPVVEEADILCSGKYQELDWLVSKDGLLVVTGIWEDGNDWEDMWGEIQTSIEDDAVVDFFMEHPPAHYNQARSPRAQLFIIDAYVDVRNVTSLERIFSGCENMESVDLSNLDTSNVKTMHEMFYYCKSLISLDLSSFDTSNVRSMDDMFAHCLSLTNLDISNWDTGNLKMVMGMFRGCVRLTSLDLSSWDTESLITTLDMFRNCTRLENLDLSNWNTEHVDIMAGMFYGCESLSTLDLSSFDTKQVREGGYDMMFGYCSNLTTIYVGAGWVDDEASNMFEGCGVDHVTMKE